MCDFRSPIIDGYRNKCEFSFGKHPVTGEVKVGFRLASYKAGSTAVVGPESLPIVSEKVLMLDLESWLLLLKLDIQNYLFR
jgi:hypothetical protein